MKLNVSEPEVLDIHAPRVYIMTSPEASASRGTTAGGIVLVRYPRHEVNGYLEVLQLTGQAGWIPAEKVRPLDVNTRCVPSVLSNGRIGFG
jgi:hypothetical protein